MPHGMNETERNYEIYDKEMLAIMLALEEWRPMLMGARHEIEILTDHQNLEYFKKPQKINRRQARWITELAPYHFTLKQPSIKKRIYYLVVRITTWARTITRTSSC